MGTFFLKPSTFPTFFHYIKRTQPLFHHPNQPKSSHTSNTQILAMSSGAKKAWYVAATIGAVEALKDQGICRWNYIIRSLHQHAKNNIRSSFFSSAAVSNKLREEKRRKAENHMKKVMELNSWGPNTVRF